MSQKYFDRLMTSSGATNKKVKSKFGEKMLAKMGWTEGKGLGKKENGLKDCVQIKRRDEGTGLGKEKKNDFKWDNNFWETMYDNVAEKLKDGIDPKAKSSSSKTIKRKSKKDRKDRKRKKEVQRMLHESSNK